MLRIISLCTRESAVNRGGCGHSAEIVRARESGVASISANSAPPGTVVAFSLTLPHPWSKHSYIRSTSSRCNSEHRI